MSNTYQLVMRKGPGPGQTFSLGKDEILIGRDIKSDIPIIDQQISRRHVRMSLQPDGYLLEDLGSTNGTFINGTKIDAPRKLVNGDLIALGGNVQLAFEVLQDSEATSQMSRDVLATSINLPTSEQTQIFISYSRKDKVFVQRLHSGITQKGIKAWVDWEGIPLSADWWAEIVSAIEGADAFLYVISPDSLNSKVCGDELRTAIDNNKRLIPILFREPGQDDFPKMHEKISSHNWIYMRDDKEYDSNLPATVTTIQTDLDWVRAHTRLLERAVEWNRNDRDRSYLLRGTDLELAEEMLSKTDKKPGLTELQVVYIQAGQTLQDELRQKELETARTLHEQAEARQRATQRFLTGVSILLAALFCAASGIFIGLFEMFQVDGQDTVASFIDNLSTYSILPAILGMGLGLVGFQLLRFRQEHGSFHLAGHVQDTELDAAEDILSKYRRAFLLAVVFFLFAAIGSAIIQAGDPDYGAQLMYTLCIIPTILGVLVWVVYRVYRFWRLRRDRKRQSLDSSSEVQPEKIKVFKRINRTLAWIVLVVSGVVGVILSAAIAAAENGYGEETFLATLNLITIFVAIFGFAGVMLVRQIIAIRERRDSSLRAGLRRAALTWASIGVVLGILLSDYLPFSLDFWFLDNFFGFLLDVMLIPALIAAIIGMVLYLPWHFARMAFKKVVPDKKSAAA